MLLPINWLKKYVVVNEAPEQVAERFIGLGFECELINDNVIDLEITPNRGDVLSIVGLAREYAASTGETLNFPEITSLTTVESLPDFTLEAEPEAYHRLAATTIHGIKNQPSPAWLKEAIESVGMNSIDLIVDLTNYVMFELGIPMHAFDLDQLPEQSFYVRLSSKGETFTSLKDEVVELPEHAIVVESGGQVIDLLGIRGGKSSMILPETQNIFVWAASVPRPLIRQAVKKTSIRTEGAYRHERETDWNMVPVALARFCQLLNELTGTQPESMIELEASKLEPKKIAYTDEAINGLLGTQYSSQTIDESLARLGFAVENKVATVPSWRHFDISLVEDLAEEVARIQGYTKLPHKVIEKIEGPATTEYAKTENLKDQLVAAGLTEVYTESFAGNEETKVGGWDTDNLDILANPVNREFAYCRPTMIPNLVKLLALNSWSDDAKVFEIGNVFPAKELEVTKLAIATYGKQQKLLSQFVPAESIQVIMPDQPLAQLHKLRRPVTVAEVGIDEVTVTLENTYATDLRKPNYQTVSQYPPSVRDVSMIIDQSVDIDQLMADIKDISPEHILLVELFDQFASDKFGPDKQSLAFHIIYQSIRGTMETATVDALHAEVTAMLQDRYAATIR